MALDSRDQVVGWMRPNPRLDVDYNSSPTHAFLWERGVIQDLGSQGLCDSLAVAINESGLVAGVIDVGSRCGEPRLFLWDGHMHIAGCPDGTTACWAYAIDGRGDVVGNAISSGSLSERGYLYRDGQFYWLDELVDAPGWRFEYPSGMNDMGQIAGSGTFNGATHAFVLTPR